MTTVIVARQLPYLRSGPIPALCFYAVFSAVIYSEYRISRSRPAPGAQDRDRGSRRAVFAGIFLSYFAAFGVSYAVPAAGLTRGRPLVFTLGLLIAVAGQGLRVWAVRQLGSSFTYTVHATPDQEVIDTGPYRLIRHPGYTGGFLVVLGMTFSLTNWLAPLTTVFAAAGLAVRIRVEEQALTETLGKPYGHYARRTKRVVPFIL